MHLLGDKHSPPSPELVALIANRDTTWSLALDHVLAATFERSTMAINPHSFEPVEYGRLHAHEVVKAIAKQEFGYLISIRDSYIWASSLFRFLHWPPNDTLSSIQLAASCTVLDHLCRDYNRCYRAWFALQDITTNLVVVRQEDLVIDPEAVIGIIADRFQLHQHNPWRPLLGQIQATWWDYMPMVTAIDSHNAVYA